MRFPRVPGSRVFRGKVFAALLRRCGIDPRQYWLLVDLFGTLSERQEVARMGSNDYAMRYLMAFLCLFGVVMGAMLAAFDVSPGIFCLALIGLTVFQLSVVLLPEVAENLVNPVEGLVLAHQPVNGATWAGAKLTHLVKLVLYVVAGINFLPAIIGVFLDHPSRFLSLTYPARHLLIAVGAGLLVALLCCSFFGWLVRFIPARRLKRAAVAAQAIPILIMVVLQFVQRFDDELEAAYEVFKDSFGLPTWWVTAVKDTVPGGFVSILGIATVAAAAIAIRFGLRSLSGDHLIRVSTLVQSGSGRRKAKKGGSAIGRWSARIAGGQAGRAGSEYLGTMMLRDWQFKLNMAGVIPLVIAVVVLPAFKGQSVMLSPFSTGFALSHLMPHALGLIIVMVGLTLSYGNDYKGTWWFLVVPITSVPLFAKGVHARLFLLLVVAPNLVWLISCIWSWGVLDAALFVAFSTVITSLYLAAGLCLIDGVPFGKQRDPSRRLGSLGGVIIFSTVVGIAIGIQYLLFLSTAAVVVAVLVGALWAYFLTRMALADLGSSMQTHLNLITLRPAGRASGLFLDFSD